MRAKLEYLKTLLENTESLEDAINESRQDWDTALFDSRIDPEEVIEDDRMRILDGKNLIDAYVTMRAYDIEMTPRTWQSEDDKSVPYDSEKFKKDWWRMIDLALR